MKFVVSAAFNDPDHLLELAASAEQCGFEAMAFPDHVVHPEKLDTPYPYTPDGSRRWSAFTPWVDPWVAIGACAAVTTHLRFTNNVFVLAMRNPFLAAKAIATAAALSRGRVTLTLGVGWSNVEYSLLGQDFRTRGRRTDEMIEVLRKLWTGQMVSHAGAFYRFDTLESNPVPPSRIPIWVGGISDAALRRAARNDGWLSDLQSTAEIETCIDKLRHFRAEQGRAGDPFDVMASASDAFTLDGYRRLADIGVTHVLTLPWIFTHGDTKVLREKKDGMRRFADDVIARL
ncbi:MAG TPA: TIGR03619 family F420-dependent LLM class oxidoreductase [Myxococcota bacterium]|nr:TIGR03619 family F420-dependent LLM class oxidoreductase [Myxococcota bacterium]